MRSKNQITTIDNVFQFLDPIIQKYHPTNALKFIAATSILKYYKLENIYS